MGDFNITCSISNTLISDKHCLFLYSHPLKGSSANFFSTDAIRFKTLPVFGVHDGYERLKDYKKDIIFDLNKRSLSIKHDKDFFEPEKHDSQLFAIRSDVYYDITTTKNFEENKTILLENFSEFLKKPYEDAGSDELFHFYYRHILNSDRMNLSINPRIYNQTIKLISEQDIKESSNLEIISESYSRFIEMLNTLTASTCNISPSLKVFDDKAHENFVSKIKKYN